MGVLLRWKQVEQDSSALTQQAAALGIGEWNRNHEKPWWPRTTVYFCSTGTVVEMMLADS